MNVHKTNVFFNLNANTFYCIKMGKKYTYIYIKIVLEEKKFREIV